VKKICSQWEKKQYCATVSTVIQQCIVNSSSYGPVCVQSGNSACPRNAGTSFLEKGGGPPICENECNNLTPTACFRFVGPPVAWGQPVLILIPVVINTNEIFLQTSKVRAILAPLRVGFRNCILSCIVWLWICQRMPRL
jgi:hypothetical protein